MDAFTCCQGTEYCFGGMTLFPLPSDGRGIKGEGRKCVNSTARLGLPMLFPLTPALSRPTGEGETLSRASQGIAATTVPSQKKRNLLLPLAFSAVALRPNQTLPRKYSIVRLRPSSN